MHGVGARRAHSKFRGGDADRGMLLTAIEERGTKEVARLLDLPEGTVKSRMYLARKRLAEELRWIVNGPEQR